jgi:hypothetical protein
VAQFPRGNFCLNHDIRLEDALPEMSILSALLRHSLILIPIIFATGWHSWVEPAEAGQTRVQKRLQTMPVEPRRPKPERIPYAQDSQLEPKQPAQSSPDVDAEDDSEPEPKQPNKTNNPGPGTSPIKPSRPRQTAPIAPPPAGTAAFTDTITIPQSSAIVVSFPAELTLDPKRKYNFPITLSLARPVVDEQGNIVLPARSLISARMKAMKGGDLIEADGVIIGGRVIPINAIGAMVPAQTRPEDFANQFVPSPGPVNNVFNSLVLWQSTALNLDPDTDTYLGAALALLAGLTTPKPKDPPPYVSISQGTVYILTLAAPITVPRQLVETGLQLQENNAGTEENFDNSTQ